MMVLMPLAMVRDWHKEPVCLQMAMGTTSGQMVAPEAINEPPDPLGACH
jgi:hypothetical protein